MDVNREQANNGRNTSLVDLFSKLKENISINTNVATLATYKNIIQEYSSDTKYGIVECSPFPLYGNETEYSLYAYFFGDYSFNQGDIVLIIYTDKDFRANLKNQDKIQKTTNTNLHSKTFGVLIKI